MIRSTIAVLVLFGLFGCASTQAFFKPKSGFVPDEATAIAIAVAVWKPIYGDKQIEGEKPYRGHLVGDVWHVDGSIPEGVYGGAAHVEIAKGDGRILGMWHTQ